MKYYNSRSTGWHDSQTNSRGKMPEESLISRDLYIMNEESELTTFQSRKGSSNIDLTVVNNRLLKILYGWVISADNSCSDHNIIKFKIGHETNYGIQYNHNGPRNIKNEQNYDRFDKNLNDIVATKFQMENTEDLAGLDRDLAMHVTETRDIVSVVENLQKAITMSCNKSFKPRENTRKPTKQKPVPWWTKELTTKRKRLNALIRRYQRTKNNEELREYRKNIYYKEKLKYKSKIKKGKIKIVERILQLDTTYKSIERSLQASNK